VVSRWVGPTSVCESLTGSGGHVQVKLWRNGEVKSFQNLQDKAESNIKRRLLCCLRKDTFDVFNVQ
jgi:hypothetical protein